MAQELWLSEQQLPQLQQLDAHYVARSGMEDAISSGPLRGRPFGGVSIAWSRDLDNVISPLLNYKHKRIVAVELKELDNNYIFISVYMPFFDSRNRETCMVETIDTISMLDIIIHDHPDHLIVLGGDLNTEFKGESPFDPLWYSFLTKNSLAYRSSRFSAPGYTYHHISLGHKKFNDHFFVSHAIASDHDYKILDEGENPSDHLPISMKMRLKFKDENLNEKLPSQGPRLKWDKVSAADKAKYHDRLEQMLRSPSSEDVPPCPGGCHCKSPECRRAI